MFSHRPASAPSSPSAPGAQEFVRPFSSGHSYRSLAVTVRVLACISILLMFANLLLGLTIWKMQPLIRIEPFFLQVEPEQNSVVRVMPIERQGDIFGQLELSWVQEYVRMREEVLPDVGQMTRRAQPYDGWIARRSTDAVYLAYRRDNETYMRQAIEERVTRRVVLDDPVRLPQRGRVYQVDYLSIEEDPVNGERSRQKRRATLEVDYHEVEVSLAEYRGDNSTNPFGFIVVSYTRSQRATGG